MRVQGEYLGMMLTIDDLDGENGAFFDYCAKGEFRLQRSVHSYGEVHHAIQPSFKDKVPYMILLVDLDTQKGQPTVHEALRVGGNLVMPDGRFAPPEVIRTVGIGTRVRMVFTAVAAGIALPQWTIDEHAEQPPKPWRYPQE